MNYPKKIALIGALLGTFAAPVAQAASASSFIDLSQFSYTTYGQLSVTMGSFNYYSSDVTAESLSDEGSNSAAISYGGASANAVSNIKTLSASATAAAGYASGYASTYSFHHTGNISLSGTGVVVFTVPYHLAIDTMLPTDQYAYSSVELGFSNANRFNDTTYDSARVERGLLSDGGLYVKKQTDGMLTLSYYYDAPSSTSFNLSARVDAAAESSIPAVPEPESYAMLLAGLGVIGSIARRRSVKA